MTWREVFTGERGCGLSAKDVREAAAFFALDGELEREAHERHKNGGSVSATKPPKRTMLHRG